MTATVVTIAAVDTATEIVTTAPAHGLLTGDPCVVRNTTGGTIVGGLAPVTVYYAIVTDPTHMKFASSSANALTGTAINLTSSGSGTNVIEYGLPYTRRRTYAALSQVKSLDLNEIQDALVAVHDFITGQPQTVWTSLTLPANQSVAVSGTGAYKRGAKVRHLPGNAGVLITTPAVTSYYGAGSSARIKAVSDVFRWNLVLEEGEQLQSVRAYVGNGTTDVVTMKVLKAAQTVGAAGNVDTQLGTTQTSTGHGFLTEQLAVTGLTENISTSIVVYTVEIACTAFATGPILYGVDYTTAVP